MNTLSCLEHIKRTDNQRPPAPPLLADIEMLIDRSGSMWTMTKETEDGTREFVNSQKEMAKFWFEKMQKKKNFEEVEQLVYILAFLP